MNKFLKSLVISVLCMAAVPMQGSSTVVVPRWSVRTVVDSMVRAVWTNRTRTQKIVGGITALAALVAWWCKPMSGGQKLKAEVEALEPLERGDNTINVYVSRGDSGRCTPVQCSLNDEPDTLLLRVYSELVKQRIFSFDELARDRAGHCLIYSGSKLTETLRGHNLGNESTITFFRRNIATGTAQ